MKIDLALKLNPAPQLFHHSFIALSMKLLEIIGPFMGVFFGLLLLVLIGVGSYMVWITAREDRLVSRMLKQLNASSHAKR